MDGWGRPAALCLALGAPIEVSSARSPFGGPWPSLLCQGDVGQWFVDGVEQEEGGILAVKFEAQSSITLSPAPSPFLTSVAAQ